MRKRAPHFAFGAFPFALCLAACAAEPAAERVALAPNPRPSPPAVRPLAPIAPVTFLEDDFERARDLARKEGKLLFVDGWAPWCHTCLSMRREVLPRPELSTQSEHYVFAALDTDREENASFVGRFPMKAWPTFFVIDPVDLTIVAERGGSLSLDEMLRFLDASSAARNGAGKDAELAKTLSTAHGLFAARDFVNAADAYERASSVDWSRRNEALLGAMRAFSSAKLDARCRTFGLKHIDDVSGSSAPSDFLYYLRDCGGRASDPEKKTAEDAALAKLRALTQHPPVGASVDDRADTLDMLAEAEADAGNADARRKAHEDRLALLEAAAKAADSPEAARVFDYARMGSYLALDRGDEAARMLSARVKELPASYEAWARLAFTLHAIHRDAEALDAIKRAIALAYGPRRLRYLGQKADIELSLGDREAAVATLGEEVAGHAALPQGQADADKLADARKRLAAAVSLPSPGAGERRGARADEALGVADYSPW